MGRQVWSGTQGKLLPSNHQASPWRQTGLRPGQRGSLRVRVCPWGWWPGTGTVHSSCGRQEVVAQLKDSLCEKGESVPVEHPHSTVGGLCPGSLEPLQRDINGSLVQHFWWWMPFSAVPKPPCCLAVSSTDSMPSSQVG